MARRSFARAAAGALAIAAVACSACSKGTPAAGGDASVDTPASARPETARAPASGSASASAAASASPAPAGAPATYKGSYESAASSFPLPANKDYDGLKWRGEKSEVGLGKGEISLTLPAGPRGTVTGTLDGPLGPAVISGYLDGDDVTARFDAKEAAPERFAGGLVGKRKDGAIEGTLDAAQDSKVLRTGPFSLKLTR